MMTSFFAPGLAILGLVLTTSATHAEETNMFTPLPTSENALSEYRWSTRPVIVFAPSEDDPDFLKQKELFEADLDGLRERDIVVLTDTSPDQKNPWREKAAPKGFTVFLVGKDGGTKLRSTSPVTVEELFSTIDRMPMRKREMQG